MDHSRFEMLLVEHVTGDLPEVVRAELDAHLQGCEGCSALHASLALGAKLAAALPIEEPPKLDMTVMRAAMRARREAAAPTGPSGAVAQAAAREPSGGYANRAASQGEANPRPGFGEVFRKWVTGPQVAMATLTGLVLAIGLTYIPLSGREMPADGDTVAAPETAPATGAPTERVAEEAAEVATPTARPSAASENARYAASTGTTEMRAEAFGIVDEPLEATNAVPVPPVAAIVPPAPIPAPMDREADDRQGRADVAEDSVAMSRRTQTGEVLAEPATQPQMAAAAPAPATPAGTTSTTAAQGQAAQSPARGVNDPAQTLAQARSLRSSGACSAATNVYQRFLNEAGTSHPQRGPAMLELADCLQRTGRTGVARQTLEQAQGVPSVAARARRELEQSSQERAPAQRARPSAAPRSSDQMMDNAYRVRD